MSRVAQYLNEHLVGDATSAPNIRARYATTASVLEITPELVLLPKVTGDVRKSARFTWQLAEKGHVMPLTPRGTGSDTTGGAVGPGIALDMHAHMHDILYVDARSKQKIVHAQAGVEVDALNQALKWQGLSVPHAPGTVGGAIAGAKRGANAGKYGSVGESVERLEVVLANGDVLETERISRRELNKRKGMQTFEGEIYRQIDGLLDDNAELINTISSERDSVGYPIDQVRGRDGSIDLTPLFIGSQGTLGVITEAVMRAGFYSEDEDVLVATVHDLKTANDIADELAKTDPKNLDIIEAEYFDRARKTLGKRYVFNADQGKQFGAVLYVSWDDYSDNSRARKLKKVSKSLSKQNIHHYTSVDHSLNDLKAVREVLSSNQLGLHVDESIAPICDGAYIPRDRVDEFSERVQELAAKHYVNLPLHIDVRDSNVHTRPILRLSRLGDKQKVFKLVAAYGQLVHQSGGTMGGIEAEGRINAIASYPNIDASVNELYASIRKIFDPHGTLNGSVKQLNEIRDLAKQLRTDY